MVKKLNFWKTGLHWLWISILIIIFDQISKEMALATLQLNQPLPITPFFNLALAFNKGSAFSFLSEASGWQVWFFAAIAFVISVVILFWLAKIPRTNVLNGIALSLILGGAIGNLLDRMIHGHVIDFIQLYYRQWAWPTFNLADSAICVGVILLIVDALQLKSDKE